MRIDFSQEEDYPGQFGLWQANCARSLKGKRGQAELKELREALLALPEKKLVLGRLQDESEGVCAIGAYGKRKGIDLTVFSPDEDSDVVGIQAGMPRLVAWKVVEMNDVEFERTTQERRYELMLRWVESELDMEPTAG